MHATVRIPSDTLLLDSDDTMHAVTITHFLDRHYAMSWHSCSSSCVENCFQMGRIVDSYNFSSTSATIILVTPTKGASPWAITLKKVVLEDRWPLIGSSWWSPKKTLEASFSDWTWIGLVSSTGYQLWWFTNLVTPFPNPAHVVVFYWVPSPPGSNHVQGLPPTLDLQLQVEHSASSTFHPKPCLAIQSLPAELLTIRGDLLTPCLQPVATCNYTSSVPIQKHASRHPEWMQVSH